MRGGLAGWFLVMTLGAPALTAQAPPTLQAELDRRAADVASRVVTWRRDFHQHPELGNRETRTAAIVAEHLRKLGMEVRTGVAHTGVVGILRGGKPGRAVALRAEMDALPVTEELDVPYASKVRTQWNGQEVGVMHACGHDAHVAMLMGAAEVLAGMRDRLPGTVTFIFQPAEEGAPAGEDGGAEMMVREGVLDATRPEAIFGLHTFPGPLGQIGYRSGALMAAGDTVSITITGKQTHGGMPWGGVDPIVIGSQVVLGLQTIVSRQVNLTEAPAVISIGRFHGGVRTNIIPDEVRLEGTVRTFDPAMRLEILRRIRQTAEGIAQAAGAKATVAFTDGNPITVNQPELTERMVPTLKRVAGEANVRVCPPTTTSEDFSYYGQKVPALFFFLYATPPEQDPATVAFNHSPRYTVDERALPLGTRALASLALDFLTR
jgi:amidohydrolase